MAIFDKLGDPHHILFLKEDLMWIRFAQDSHLFLKSTRWDLIYLLDFDHYPSRNFSTEDHIQIICIISHSK